MTATYSLCMCLITQSCSTLCDPMECNLPGTSVHGDSSGKNTRMGCHALLQGIFPIQGSNPGIPYCRWIIYHLSYQGSPNKHYEVEVKVTQSCSTLCDPKDYTVHGILQARILEWIAFTFSRASSQPRNRTQVSRMAGRFFTS